MKRLLFIFLFFIASTSLYPWAALVILVWASFSLRPLLWEYIILGLLLDSMWGLYDLSFVSIPLFTIVTVGILFTIRFIKNRMNIHA